MSKTVRSLRLQRLQGQLGDVAYELTKVHFAAFHAVHPRWQPAVNAYLCERRLRICVDLAGVGPTEIQIEVAPGLLTLRGSRTLPEPDDADAIHMRVLAMEIDHGAFERRIELPPNIDRAKVRAKQENGMLWIFLPLLHH